MAAIEAICGDCDDIHPVGDRRLDGRDLSEGGHLTTLCPACGAVGYSSRSTGGTILKSEAERIADAVRAVPGVGPDTSANLQAAFDLYAELEAATRDQLLDVDGVGPLAADGIRDRVGAGAEQTALVADD